MWGFIKGFIIVITMLFLLIGCAKEQNITPENQIESVSEQSTHEDAALIEVGYQKITAEEAKTMIDKGEYGVILDVRTLEEYNAEHIEDATLLPDNEIKEKAETILDNKDEVILVYCRSGRRSEAAVKELIDMGYTRVYDFGGITDWPYEVVKE